MNLVSVLLYPIALLLPAAGAMEGESEAGDAISQVRSTPEASQQAIWPETPARPISPVYPYAATMAAHAQPAPAWQVHIEQRMQIRITPRAPAPDRRDVFVGIPGDDFGARLSERKIGKCVSINAIAGVQPDRGSRLLLYMRNRTLIAADLERSCRARDFYSGFYLARTEDGQLCIDRDNLLSRSGMNCKLTRIRQLVESER